MESAECDSEAECAASRGYSHSEPKPKRTYNSESTRAALIEAATRLFELKGFHATSIQEIVSAAGVTKGALYYHFPQKDDLLVQIHERFLDEYFVLTEEVRGRRLDPILEIRLLTRAVVTVNGRFRREVVIFAQERRALRGKKYEGLRARRRRITVEFVECISRGQESKVFRGDIDPWLAARAILGMCGWMSQWYFDSNSLPYEVIAEAFERYATRMVI